MNEMKKTINWMIESLGLREVVETAVMIDFLKTVVDYLDELDYEVREKKMADISKLREQYFLIVGNKPYLWWWVEVLELKLAELKDKNEVKWDSLASKKSWWTK